MTQTSLKKAPNQKRSNRDKKSSHQKIAQDRIAELFTQADGICSSEPKLADRYVLLARKMSLRYKVAFTRPQKLRFCKSCFKHLIAGKNSRIRVSRGKITVLCQNCKNIMRFSYKKA
jgi:ribonuclease P protein subunit RPR2